MAEQTPIDIPAYPNPLDRNFLWKFLQYSFRFCFTMAYDLKVYGRHNVPRTGGALMVSNHQSYLDPILLSIHLNRPISHLAKAELFENPLFGRTIRSLYAFPIRRGEGDIGAIREILRRLKEGYLLNLFPEGTRSKTGELGPIQSGVAMVVKRAKVPVIPAVIDGSFNALKGGKIGNCHIRLEYGPPLQLDGLDSHEIPKLIDTTFRRMLNELRQRTNHSASTDGG